MMKQLPQEIQVLRNMFRGRRWLPFVAGILVGMLLLWIQHQLFLKSDSTFPTTTAPGDDDTYSLSSMELLEAAVKSLKDERMASADSLAQVTAQLELAQKHERDLTIQLAAGGGGQLGASELESLHVDPMPFREPIEPGHHRLAVMVPFRNVMDELVQFVPHISQFLKKQNIDFRIIVINQTDQFRFNRAQLLNAGFLVMEQACDYVVMHDVDLLPLNANLSYRYPNNIMHIASSKFHPMYKFPKFIGGIMIMKNEDFRAINGLSNKYWGWGREDDDLLMRIKKADLKVEWPENYTEINTGRSDTLLHLHDRLVRPRDYMKLGRQRAIGKTLDNVTGLRSARHHINRIEEKEIGGFEYTHVDIELDCNIELTPWCKMYEHCLPGYFKLKPEHKICTPCNKKCWVGFVLVGECTNSTTPYCLKVGRDISESEAAKWPQGHVIHPPDES